MSRMGLVGLPLSGTGVLVGRVPEDRDVGGEASASCVFVPSPQAIPPLGEGANSVIEQEAVSASNVSEQVAYLPAEAAEAAVAPHAYWNGIINFP